MISGTMQVSQVGSNMTEIVYPDGRTVLYSYTTPVAAFLPKIGHHIRSEKSFNVTTSKHVNKWLDSRGAAAEKVPHHVLLDHIAL